MPYGGCSIQQCRSIKVRCRITPSIILEKSVSAPYTDHLDLNTYRDSTDTIQLHHEIVRRSTVSNSTEIRGYSDLRFSADTTDAYQEHYDDHRFNSEYTRTIVAYHAHQRLSTTSDTLYQAVDSFENAFEEPEDGRPSSTHSLDIDPEKLSSNHSLNASDTGSGSPSAQDDVRDDEYSKIEIWPLTEQHTSSSKRPSFPSTSDRLLEIPKYQSRRRSSMILQHPQPLKSRVYTPRLESAARTHIDIQVSPTSIHPSTWNRRKSSVCTIRSVV